MTSPPAERPLIPQPPAPATVTALRQAVAQIAPAALPAFTRELDQAADQARQESDLVPLRRFIAQWVTHVHIQRQPHLAQRLRQEDTAATGDTAQARSAASEIGRMLDDALAAVVPTQR